MISQTEENYLKAIYKISENDEKSASTNAISRRMKTSAASVTDMLKRLAEKSLINYIKYKGVTLTPKGVDLATKLIRNHRLWEVFLVDKLEFRWDEVHELAEQMEHIHSDELINKLDAYLGYPKFDPHGDPIPNAQGKYTLRSQIELNQLRETEAGVVVGLKYHEKPFLQHLDNLGIALGTQINVLQKNTFDQSIKISIDHSKETFISNEVSKNLLVKKNIG